MKQIEEIPQVPPRPDGAHKGTFGMVIVVGGSEAMIGAPALCARAAFRSGVGLVKIACPHSILPHVISIEPSATGIAIGGEPEDALDQIERADPQQRAVLAIGPGLGQDPRSGELVQSLITGSRPVVLDADGLNLLAKQLEADPRVVKEHGPLVVTPHPGEFNRLAAALGIDLDATNPAERVDAAAALSRKLAAVVLLKGHRTVIAKQGQFAVNPTGSPALATAGSGDVLTGLIASLIAQGMDPFKAAHLGAYVHGLAADRWSEQYGLRGLRAIELADWLPTAFGSVPGL